MIKATTTVEKVILPKPGLYVNELGRRIKIRNGDQTLLDTAQERKVDNLKKAEEKRARKKGKKLEQEIKTFVGDQRPRKNKIVLKTAKEWEKILEFQILDWDGFKDVLQTDRMSSNEFRQRAQRCTQNIRKPHY